MVRKNIEMALLGGMLIYPKYSHGVFEALHTNCFSGKNKNIYEAFKKTYLSGSDLSIISIAQNYKGEGLSEYLMRCMEYARDTIGAEALRETALHLLEGWQLLSFREAAVKAASLEEAYICARSLFESGVRDEIKKAGSIASNILDRQRRISEGQVERGFAWGIKSLDRRMMLQPGEFYLIGGIKKGAKTIFLTSILDYNASEGVPILFFSLEETADRIIRKILCKRAGINSRKIYTPFLSGDEAERLRIVAGEMEEFPLYIDDTASLSAIDIVARARAWKYRYDIAEGIVAVDYLQLMRIDQKRGELEASAIKHSSYEIARMAKTLGFAVISTAQLANRAEGEVPRVRDVEGSGGPVQACEGLLLLDLESRRGIEQDKETETLNVIIGVQRGGESGVTVTLEADLKTGNFYDRYEI